MKITGEAIRDLAIMALSCKPIMGETLTGNQRYIIETTKSGKGAMTEEEFLGGMPLPSKTYSKIFDYAREIDVAEVDEEIIWKFFGSDPHVEKIRNQVRENNLPQRFGKMILFAHILIPITITGDKDGLFSGVYGNAGVEVKLESLIPVTAMSIKEGDRVLVHYASIIANRFGSEIENYLLETQARNNDFMEACKVTKRIDYSRFWDLCKWTQNNVKEQGL